MNYIFAIILVLGLSACSERDKNSRFAQNGNGGGNGEQNTKPDGKRTNDTNYRVCGTAAAATNDPTGRWEMFESQGQSDFKIALEFSSNQLVLRQDCFNQGRRLTAQVTVPAHYSNGTLTILGDADNTQKTEDKIGSFDCKVALNKETSTFSLKGNCLELTNFQKRSRLVFVPQ
jgi:hypothetical protein